MLLNNIKEIYPEIKFFKTYAVKLGKSTDLMFYKINPEDESNVYKSLSCSDCPTAKILFKSANNFYLLAGFISEQSLFLKWLTSFNCIANISIEQIKAVSKILKKDLLSIEYDENQFIINTASSKFVFNNERTPENLDRIKKLEDFEKELVLTSEFSTENFLSLIKLYDNNGFESYIASITFYAT